MIKRYKSGTQQSACLVVNPITFIAIVFLFDSTTVGQASDSMTVLDGFVFNGASTLVGHKQQTVLG